MLRRVEPRVSQAQHEMKMAWHAVLCGQTRDLRAAWASLSDVLATVTVTSWQQCLAATFAIATGEYIWLCHRSSSLRAGEHGGVTRNYQLS